MSVNRKRQNSDGAMVVESVKTNNTDRRKRKVEKDWYTATCYDDDVVRTDTAEFEAYANAVRLIKQ